MRLNLITCRNLLIYLERNLQRQLLALFHYALTPGGFLFLGSAESVDTRPQLFAPADREARDFVALPRTKNDLALLTQLPAEHRPPQPPLRTGNEERSATQVHVASLEAVAPPSVLMDDERRVLHLSESAGRFLQPSVGPLSADLSVLVSGGSMPRRPPTACSPASAGRARSSAISPMPPSTRSRTAANASGWRARGSSCRRMPRSPWPWRCTSSAPTR